MKRKCYDYAILQLNYRSRSEHEMSKRLRKAGYGACEIKNTMEKLKTYKFIDDRSFAENFAKSQSQKLKGSGLIKAQLLNKGVSSDIINDILKKEQDDDRQLINARKLALKALPALRNKTKWQKTQRVARMLAGRGYPASVIYSVVKGCLDSELAEPEQYI